MKIKGITTAGQAPHEERAKRALTRGKPRGIKPYIASSLADHASPRLARCRSLATIKTLIGRRKREIGTLGEALVVKHLKNRGFVHIESNFLRRQGELDVIMGCSGKIHFIEVKTVSRENMLGRVTNSGTPCVIRETVTRETATKEADNYLPEENVSAWKIKKISRVVQIYLCVNNLEDREWQFDVAVVYLDRKNKKALIKFIKDIPLCA